MCATSRRGGFRGRGTGRSGGSLSLCKVFLKGKVDLVKFEEARLMDSLVPGLLPAFVMHKVLGPNGVQFRVRLVPNLAFEDFGLVDEGPVVAEYAFIHSEGWC